MVCIYCSSDTRVVNSRLQRRSNNIWRRRHCQNCGTVFTSIEKPELTGSVVVRTPKAMQPFSADKLFISVHNSLKHRKTALSDARGLTDTVVGRLLLEVDQAELHRDRIVEVVLGVLKRFDRAASIQYAAYHPIGV